MLSLGQREAQNAELYSLHALYDLRFSRLSVRSESGCVSRVPWAICRRFPRAASALLLRQTHPPFVHYTKPSYLASSSCPPVCVTMNAGNRSSQHPPNRWLYDGAAMATFLPREDCTAPALPRRLRTAVQSFAATHHTCDVLSCVQGVGRMSVPQVASRSSLRIPTTNGTEGTVPRIKFPLLDNDRIYYH